MSLIIIGDVHGLITNYYNIITKITCPTVQIGDFGFYEELRELQSWTEVNPKQHRLLRGNHDAPLVLPHHLGDFGSENLGGIPFFFVRGASSMDQVFRTEGIDWWADEELTYTKLIKAIEKYTEILPKVVLTHECPAFLLPQLVKPPFYPSSATSVALNAMWKEHKPQLWVFGHYHVSKQIEIGRTLFICLSELETYEISNSDIKT